MPLDSAETIANALNERTSKSHGKKARKTKKSGKTVKARPARRESTKTITTRLYKKWAEIVHGRAGDRCEVCGVGGKLDAHHIQPRQICSGLRFDPENGICLCSSHHRFGHESAHKGMLWFCEWLRHNRPLSYKYVYDNRDKELDCKNRSTLYAVEEGMHRDYSEIASIGILPTYRVRFVGKTVEESLDIQADNPKAAEYLCQKSAGCRIKVIGTGEVKHEHA